jgi:hypothetical protein
LVKTLPWTVTEELKSRKGIRGITPYILFLIERGVDLYPDEGDVRRATDMIEIHHVGDDQLYATATKTAAETATEMLFSSFEQVGQRIYGTPYKAIGT